MLSPHRSIPIGLTKTLAVDYPEILPYTNPFIDSKFSICPQGILRML
ncbi:hypothetical protein GO730_33380 [Spirosoma sp. HMF3257]|nr:hypothetical protein [Spirosoma telluris]